MRRRNELVSLGDIAKVAGVSKSAVCLALQNRPKVSAATRQRILEIAKQLGYVPDARVASWMSTVHETKSRELLPIAWLSTHHLEHAWHKYKFLLPYLEGAQKQAEQMGYRIEEIWTHQVNMTKRRISEIIYQRGIEGLIVSYHERRLHFHWERLAGVSLGPGLMSPQLHQVSADLSYNFSLAFKMLRRFGYQRIGVVLDELLDRLNTHHTIRAINHYHNSMASPTEAIPPLFYQTTDSTDAVMEQVVAWYKRHKPEVIICHHGEMVKGLQEAGYRVPEDVGVVHLATDDDVSDWAGIHSNRRAIGAAAVNQVVSLIRSRQFGVPEVALHTFVRGTWHRGKTLLIPKP